MPQNTAHVLVIGLDPLRLKAQDWDVTPEHNAEVRAKIAASETALREAGYEADFCLLDLNEDIPAAVLRRLGSRPWDCVIIGGGIRKPEELSAVFEQVINLVHRHAPAAVIGFNDRPDDVLAAVERSMAL